MIIKLAVIIVFFAVLIAVGMYSRRHTKSVEGFVLGGRSINPWMAALAYGTAYFSAVVFVGYAGQFGWRFGISSIWIGLGNAFIGCMLAWIIFGKRTRIMTHHLDSSTMPEFFASRYDSQFIKILSAIIIFIFMIPYSASLFNGLGRIFAMSFDIDFRVCIILMAVITGIYVIGGGFIATAINDVIQGTITLIGVAILIGVILNTNGGVVGALDSLARVPADANMADTPGVFSSILGPDPINLLGVVILTSLGTWGLPQMVHKFYVIKSEKAFMPGVVISTIFAIIVSGGCYVIGSFGRLSSDIVEYRADGSVVYDSIIPSMMQGFPDILIALVLVLVLAASISTLASTVMASSTTLTLNLIKGHIVKNMSEKAQVLNMRMLIAVFVVISAAIAVLQYTYGFAFIAQLMSVSWGGLSGAFLAPFLYGLYWKRTTKIAALSNMLLGSMFMLVNFLANIGVFPISMFPPILQSSINAGAFIMLFSLIFVPVVSLLTPKLDRLHVDDCFSCIEGNSEANDSEENA